MAAPDVGHERPALQLADHLIERGQPLRAQVGVVAGPEELLAAVEDIGPVLVPAEPGPAARRFCDPRRVDHRTERELEEPGKVAGAACVCEGHRLLEWQEVAAGLRLVVSRDADLGSAAPLTN